MTAVPVETEKTLAVRRPETGWATARRLRGQRIRTCVRATIDGDVGRSRRGNDWNVVRGVD
ncbi:hypothetical protein PYK79_46185 [Streptomyces sp. ID05-04B]|uniref:hypothetical protein n=1 Tax=unclassified Streptomyces TaxID=2593676 RepID=UPI000D1ABBB9|nr:MULTISPECIES: hypothetical protein [unclassified Streptomyces]AVV44440.1 hypothetical protein C6376_26400 [Streptomyces sp. P3]MDX5569207.1 hypothetical protein [Streptomyces sp. ID05-04B]